MRRIKRSSLVGIIVVSYFTCFGSALLQDAAAAFDNNDYKKSAALFQQAYEEGHRSFELYHNLGTSYAKNDQLDLARLYLEKAILLKPGNKNAANNIKWIKTELSENFAPIPEFYPKTLWKIVSSSIQYKIWIYLAFIFLCLAAYCLWQLLFYRGKERSIKMLIPFFLSSLSIALLFFLFGYTRSERLNNFKEYVIMAKPLEVLIEPESSAEIIQRLYPGAKVELENELGEWKEIIAEDGSKGWIHSNDLAKIEL